MRLMGSMQRKLALLVGFMNAGASLAIMFSAGGVVEVVYGEVIILSLLGLILGASSRSVRSLTAGVIKGGTVLEATAIAQRPQGGTLATFLMGGLPLSPSGFGSARKLKGLLGAENTPVKITYAKPAGQSASPERLLILGANGAQIPTPFLCSWGGR